MKKWQALGSAAALLATLLLGGCSGQQAAATPEQAATPSPAATAEPTPVPAPAGNPLTGLDDADYTGKRPVAVMLRTLDGAQPQWGIASADVLIEGVTEGNTAGLMALFADVDRISKVGPVGPGRQSRWLLRRARLHTKMQKRDAVCRKAFFVSLLQRHSASARREITSYRFKYYTAENG